MQHKTFFAMSLIVVLFLTGCKNPDSKYVKVEGTITYNGEAVEGATVVFMAVDPGNESGTGTTDAGGKYTLTSAGATSGGTGVQPGEYTVTVKKTLETRTPDPDEVLHEKGEITYDELQARMSRKGLSGGTKVERKELLPAKYGQPSSGLKASVVKGKNPPFDFPLTD